MMETENENMYNSAENAGGSHEGAENNGQPRRQRVRITSQRASYGSAPRQNYRSNDEGGFRPGGFGAGLDNHSGEEGGYQPRQSYGNRGGYGNRDNGGYNRGGYNNNRGGGYGNRDNGGYNRGGYNNNRRGYGQQRPYRQYNNEGAEGENAQEGYGQQGGYNNRGGYGNRQGGYNNNRGGGYSNRQGGYNNNRGGGYGNRQGGGYGNRQGGYNNNRGGGYGNRQHTPGYDPNAKYSMKKRIEYKETNIDPTAPVRLNKFLANAGVCSRREADDFIEAGVVTVNGQVVTELGTKILRTDEVKFHDQPVTLEKKVYVLLNKPKDYVTTSDDPQQRKTVMDLVQGACPERIYPVGRLDRNTTGVLLLTNDGDLASKLTHPKFLKKKVYHVYLDKNVTVHDMQQIAEGITLDDGEIHADAIDYAHDTDKKQVGIEIHSGKNRIVRRIFESLGYRVTKLDRVQFAGLTKKNLRRGDWRFLTEKEVDMLRMGAFE